MIEITINGEQRQIEKTKSIAQVLQEADFDCGRVAVAINSVFVARSSYDKQTFDAGDNVDVVAPMSGG